RIFFHPATKLFLQTARSRPFALLSPTSPASFCGDISRLLLPGMRSSAQNRVARGLQREFERFFRHALDKGSNQPVDCGGNVASQRDGLALNVHTAAGIEIFPI